MTYRFASDSGYALRQRFIRSARGARHPGVVNSSGSLQLWTWQLRVVAAGLCMRELPEEATVLCHGSFMAAAAEECLLLIRDLHPLDSEPSGKPELQLR